MTPPEEQDAIADALERRRAAVAEAWALSSEIVLVGAGALIPVPGRGDMTYPFRAHSEYFYLTDCNRPDGVLAFDPGEGWIHFQTPVTEADRLWSGAPDSEPDGPTTDALPAWLRARSEQPLASLGCPLPGLPGLPGLPDDGALTERLRDELSRVRRPKDAVELHRMRAAAAATREAFAALEAFVRPGVTEREVQIELEMTALRAGADAMAYDTIVGSGPNAAVLHFAPTQRRLGEGELVLIDAGGECRGYASDVTRTYVAGGSFSAEQAEIYTIVQESLEGALEHCRPGVEWRDVHRLAAVRIAEGLAGVGLLRGSAESLVDSGAVGLFFPHGIGHLVGLGVRDAGGILPERRDQPPPYPNLRIDLPLEPGMVVTVEPGIYFVPAILRDARRRETYRDEVAWDRVDRMLGFGGVRIEENALITESGHEILTRRIPQPRP